MGGGGGVFALNKFLEKKLIAFTIFFLQHNDNVILFAVSIGFLCVRGYGLTAYQHDSIFIICTEISEGPTVRLRLICKTTRFHMNITICDRCNAQLQIPLIDEINLRQHQQALVSQK